jgi:glycosyltransferase involved in cell wall biosynthesis
MKVFFVIPVYNDWKSLKVLSTQIKEISLKEKWREVELVIVNDASTQELDTLKDSFALKSTILNLISNQGNQKAITIGLSYIDEKINDFDYIIIMDADGEDKPSDIINLIEAAKKNEEKKIVFVKRAKRNEGLIYILFYTIYKILFSIFTGQKINLGHFSCVPKNFIKKILSISGIWTHYVAATIKSKLPFTTVVCDKGERISGLTKQNKNMLILHGLASMSVYMEIIVLRLLLISLLAMLLTAAGIATVFYIKIFTNISALGWATNTSIGLIIIFIIFFLTSFFSLLTLLNKNLNPTLPSNTYKHFILNIIKL